MVFRWFYKVFRSRGPPKMASILGGVLEPSWEASWRRLGGVLAASWRRLGASWSSLGASWRVLGVSRDVLEGLGAPWGRLGSV